MAAADRRIDRRLKRTDLRGRASGHATANARRLDDRDARALTLQQQGGMDLESVADRIRSAL
jgi:hypothetical protein